MLLCFGSPLLDIIVKVDKVFLKKYNLEENLTYPIEKVGATFFEDLRKFKSLQYQVGGSITNTVKHLRAFSPTVDCVYVGSIGQDDNGALISKNLRDLNIKFCFAKSECETGRCAVLLINTNNTRTLVTDLGASQEFTTSDLSEVSHYLDKAEFVYFSTFFIKVSFEVVREVLQQKPLILNLGAPFIIQKFPEEVRYMFEHARLVFGNEREFKALSANYRLKADDPRYILKELSKIEETRRILVMTRGENSVLLQNNGQISEYNVGHIEENDVINTNGAADAFVSGFLGSYLQNATLPDCVRNGIVVAKLVISK